MIDLSKKKVVIFDLDDTLIKTVSGETFAKDATDFIIRKEVLDKTRRAMPDLSIVCIATNQGGIPKFMSQHDFNAKLRCISAFIEGYLNENLNDIMIDVYAYYCASLDKGNPMRKPNTGMLERFFEDKLRYAAPILKDKANMLMIGDASGKEGQYGDSDKLCAEAFGIDYLDVEDFLSL